MNSTLASVTPPDRDRLLAQLDNTPAWDVIVIGGGATGLGTAVDAASRGYRTLLIEGADFAKGTSSKAKLVHGGVRYLAQGNVSLVREALHERGLLNRNAPHLVWPLGFVVPAYNLLDQPFYGIGLKMYDMLAGKLNLSPSRWLSRRDTLANAPTLAEQVNGRGLKGGVLYYDGQFDDARLAMSLMRTLFDLGGTAVNYVRATGLTMTNGKVDGVTATDALGDAVFTLRARCVINATGVWVDAVRRMEDKNAPTMVAPSQGVHPTLPRDFLPGKRAILIPKTDDGRVLFVVPWNGHTIVGTTDTPRDDLPLDPDAGAHDVDFILGTAARYLSRKPTRDDVTSVWAGLRPGQGHRRGIHQDAVARTHHPGVQGRPGHGHGRKMDHLPPHGAGRGQHGHQNQLLTQAPAAPSRWPCTAPPDCRRRRNTPARRTATTAATCPRSRPAGRRAHAGQRQRPVRSPCALRRPLRAGAHRRGRAGASQPRPVPGQRGRHAGSAGSRPYPGRGTRPRRRLAARCATWNRWRRAIACAEARDFMRRQPPALYASAALCAALGAPAAGRDGGRTAGAGLAPPTAAASETANGDARDCAPTERAGGKVIDIYWTRGLDHGRITGGEVDHYVDLNLVVRTRGYFEGDCVEATVQATDGGDIVEGRKTLTLHGRVDKAGSPTSRNRCGATR